MKLLANALLVAGTVLGALGGARVPQAEWSLAGAGVALLVVGALLLRRGGAAAATAGAPGAGGDPLEAARGRVRALAEHLEALRGEAAALPLTAVRDRIGALDRDFLRPLGDEAPALLPRLGPAEFARTFGVYATGERAVHRAWSAATDGHRPEALASLDAGTDRIRNAADALDGGGPAR